MTTSELSEFELRGIRRFDEGFWSGLKPDPILTVTEWADAHRMLSSVASAEPGRWRTSRTPYLKEIMDCLSALSPIREVVFMKGAQIGATEAGNNWIGYVIDHVPGPMMAVQPNLDLAKRNSKTRIKSLIESSERLSAKVKSVRSRDSGNTVLAKEFQGGILVMSGASSAVSLRSMPVRFLMLDEIDGYPQDVDGEGDPVGLAEARTRTFARKKIYKVSTPTFEGRSKIQHAYEQSDKRRYFVPCPHCKGEQWLKWSQVKWPEGKPHEAYYVCELCSEPIFERHKTYMLEHGRWVAENPGAGDGKVAGFHLSALYSPVGWFSWGDAAVQFVAAKDRPDLLRAFVNTALGETWKEKGDAPEWEKIARELYAVGSVPEPVVFLTAGVDVQKDRLECEVVGWGRDKQSWSIEQFVLPGDTSTDVPWEQLAGLLSKTWEKASGHELGIKVMAVDTGYNTQHVYNWVRKWPISKVMAVKGFDQGPLLLGQPSAVDITIGGKRIRRGLKLWPVSTGVAKGELYAWLQLRAPTAEEMAAGKTFPGGYCHFPQYGDEFFKQMTAEQLVVRIVKGYRKYEWEKTRDRNEALDCRVYARAAAAAAGIDRFSESQWLDLAGASGLALSKPKTEEKKTDGAASPPPPQPKPERKKSTFW